MIIFLIKGGTLCNIYIYNTGISACAWDKYDVNTETPDGRNTLHATVGICYQNESPENEGIQVGCSGSFSGRPRRRFEGTEKIIPPFHTSLKLAKFTITSTETEQIRRLKSNEKHIQWLIQSIIMKIPLFTGFISKYSEENRTKSLITYMDPIGLPPTRNDVVQETMVRTLQIAEKMNQSYGIASYDLAVALKAYAIQSIQAPKFDKLIILVGNFHLEMAFFGAIGTYIIDSGIEYVLTESGVLAAGSLTGFLKGKFYNRCTRIHQIIATVMEKLLFEKFKSTLTSDDERQLELILSIENGNEEILDQADNAEIFKKILDKYDEFFFGVIDGELGNTAAFWAIYVYLINRVYRNLDAAVRTNNVNSYIQILSHVVNIFFALNRPNYARWGCFFMQAQDTGTRSIGHTEHWNLFCWPDR